VIRLKLGMAVVFGLLSIGVVAPQAMAAVGAAAATTSTPKVTTAPPYTAFVLDSDPSTIGFGQQLDFNASNSTITAVGTSASVHLTVIAPSHNFDAILAAPTGEALAVGDYTGAVREATATQAGLDIYGDSVGCNAVTGQFTVEQIAFDSLGNISQFAVDAEMHCEGDTPDLFATFRLASTVGYTALALPAPYVTQTGSVPLPTELVGQTSPTVQITASNAGVLPLSVAPTITGIYEADYQITSSTCSASTPLAPGTSCTISVAFTPHALGDRSASLVITDNTPRGQLFVGLDGIGTTQPTFAYPVGGQQGVDTTQPFTWTPSPGAQAYYLVVGRHSGTDDLVNSGVVAVADLSFPVPALPTGQSLYATVFAETNGQWTLYQSITFAAAAQVATFGYPLSGQSNNDSMVGFNWTTNSQDGGYYLVVGTTAGSANLINSGVLPATQGSYQAPPMPSDITLYATIFTEWAGAWNQSRTISFAFESEAATFTSPVSGGQVTDMSAPFTWSASQYAQAYYLVVSTTPGGANLVNSGVLPLTQTYYRGVQLPKGVKLYATIFTQIGNGWNYYQTITFTTG
jgi:hypothetical protein